MNFLKNQDFTDLQKILIENSYLRSSDSNSRRDLLEICGLGELCGLVKLEDPLIYFVPSLCNKLSNIYTEVDGTKKISIIVLLEYILSANFLFQLTIDEQKKVSEIISRWEKKTLNDEKSKSMKALIEEVSSIEFPEGQVGLTSQFYIERPPIEEDCYEGIEKTGCLIRIKAPKRMGKSSLLSRILRHAENKGYRAVPLYFSQLGSQERNDLDKLLQWLCKSVALKLNWKTNQNWEDDIVNYWDGILGSGNKCTNFVQKSFLLKHSSPIVLGLDGIDSIFPDHTVSSAFLGLIRSWHEQGKYDPIWGKLRLIITHSKEPYSALEVNQSPFNVGFPVELPQFSELQIEELIEKHGISWKSNEISQLINMFGGHPYLLRVGLYFIAKGRITLSGLLSIAPTEEGPFRNHLYSQLVNIKNDTTLRSAMAKLVKINDSLRLDVDISFKLYSLGLVKYQGNNVRPSCDLYRIYFKNRLEES